MEHNAKKRHKCVKCGRKRYACHMHVHLKHYRLSMCRTTNGFSWRCLDSNECNKIVQLSEAKRT